MSFEGANFVQTRIMLDRIFICQTCGATILFESDRDNHELKAGHSRFIIHDLAAGKTRMEKGEEIDL